jgi:hypothetical protein
VAAFGVGLCSRLAYFLWPWVLLDMAAHSSRNNQILERPVNSNPEDDRSSAATKSRLC